MINVLLDRSSIANGDSFIKLKNSKFKYFIKKGLIRNYGNPYLIIETFNQWFSNNKLIVKEQLEYILSTINERWFDLESDIFRKELEGRSSSKYIYVGCDKQKSTIDMINKEIIYSKQMDISLENELRVGKNKLDIKAQKFIEIFKEKRRKISDFSDKIGKKISVIKKDFTSELLIQKEISWYGEEYIEMYIDSKYGKKKLISKWKKYQDQYCYFNLFLKGLLFTYHLFTTDHNKPLDGNIQSDLAQVIYLKDLDILVSNETHYMKDLFLQLYGNTKKLLTTDKFIEYINDIYPE